MNGARLWSLLDMLMNYAEAFTMISADIEKGRAQILVTALQSNIERLTTDMPMFAQFKANIEKLLATCQQVPELDRMLMPCGRTLAMMDAGTDPNTFHHDIDHLQHQLFDELRRLKLYLVPSNLVIFYENELPFGQEVFDRFPSAVPDTRNAGRCLALGQPTAAMFHLMRVMERGLAAYAAKLGIPYAPSWESYIRQLNKRIDVEWDKKEKTWKRVEPWHKEILEDLIAVKTAWRNPTIHIEADYNMEESVIAYMAVRAFMMELAKKVKEPSQRRRIALPDIAVP